MQKQTILFQGDSITDGNRGRSDDPNHILGHCYAYIAAAELGYSSLDKNYEFINKGISGNTAADLYARWQKDCLSLNPDIVSILVGINDAAEELVAPHKLLCSRYDATLRLMLNQTKEVLPDIKIILMEPFILDSGNKEREEYQKLLKNVQEKQQTIRNLAKEFNATFIPLQDRFHEAAKKKTANYWIWDSIHPTYAGHGLIAHAWLEDTRDMFDSIGSK